MTSTWYVAPGARELIRSLPEGVRGERVWRRVAVRGALPGQTPCVQIINFDEDPVLDLTFDETLQLAQELIDVNVLRLLLDEPKPAA